MKKNNYGLILVLATVLSFIFGTIGAYLIVTLVPTTVKTEDNITISENSIADAVDKAYNAVVVVSSYQNNVEASTGTGFVYKIEDSKAYVMTNNHVIEGSDKILLTRSDGVEVEATLVGSETYCDIAVLSINASDALGVVTIGDSTAMRLGDTVFTIGSPMGITYAGSVTKGILSGKDRLVEVSFSGSTSDYYMKVLQIDAALNPGNSGGPLLNVNGEVIGVNSLKLVEDEIEGMGFAIPIEDAIFYAETLESGSKIVRPYFGISMLDISDSYYMWKYNITIPSNITEGVVVLEVEDGSPASKAGLQKADIIVKLGDADISSIAEFRYELYKHQVGEEVEVKYIRDGETKTATVTLVESNQ